MPKKTVLINDVSHKEYQNLFPEDEWEITYNRNDDRDLTLLVGKSSDVHPSLYGEKVDLMCGNTDIAQDKDAKQLYNHDYLLHGIPMVGICKGAQQLCVFTGGKLIQHVPRVGDHTIWKTDGTTLEVPADHHQVMVPSEYAHVEATKVGEGYPEVVWFTRNLLGIQFHPEWNIYEEEVRNYWLELLDTLMTKTTQT